MLASTSRLVGVYPSLLPNPPMASYSFSFMAASLRPDLARIVAEYYLMAGDWEVAKARVLSANALQCRSARTAVRMERELRQRLGTLTRPQLILLAEATAEDRDAMAWLAAVKYNPFIFGFAADALREKLAAYDPVLRRSDYETYVDHEAISHPELAQLTASSRTKVRQILLRMLTEAGVLLAGPDLGTIRRPILSPIVYQLITADNPRWLAAFLVPDTEIGYA
jgi:Putative inner membrane protein (DUF1819)